MEFVNPYTFVPFGNSPERCAPEEIYQDSHALLHGWLDISLITKSELIIPDPSTQKEARDAVKNPHYQYDFFKDSNKNPLIPGSEIRGMIRSIYETITDSCVSALLDTHDFSMRLPLKGGVKNRGLLQKTEKGWRLIKKPEIHINRLANAWDIKNKEGKYNGKNNAGQVFYQMTGDGFRIVEKSGENEAASVKTGVLQFNIPVNPNNKYSVAVLSVPQNLTDKIVKEWLDDSPYLQLKKSLEDNLDNERKKQSGSFFTHRALLRALEEAKKTENETVPVYYWCDREEDAESTGQYYLSGSSIGRVYQNRSWKEVMGKYEPCCGKALCPACLLFGSENGFKKLRGRVRFSDATWSMDPSKNPNPFSKSPVVLPILSSPKYSAYEFYLNAPSGAVYWNYDYYAVRDDKSIRFEPYPEGHIIPRGRKYYWHQIFSQSPKTKREDGKKDNQNASMEVLLHPEDQVFKGKIYFDGVTQKQLKQLMWAVCLGDNRSQSNIMQKIGHGKPLNYGSVKLVIDACSIRKVLGSPDGTVSIRIDKYIPDEQDGNILKCCGDSQKEIQPEVQKSAAVQSLLAVSDAEKTRGLNVDYPRLEENGEIFKWFGKNRSSLNPQCLPKPDAEKIFLSSDSISGGGTGRRDIKDLKIGECFTGTVKRINEKIGAFVDIGASRDGLVHISKMARGFVSDPRDIVSEGDRVKVWVIKVDEAKQQISLTMVENKR